MEAKKWPFFTEKMINNVTKVLRSGEVNQWTGTKVKEFEKKFAKYFDTKYAIAVFNGSVAIELCLKAIGIEAGDEVIVTPRTFIASATSIILTGGTPVFTDVDMDSQNITLETIKEKITDKTKAIILVHLAGWPCDLHEICKFCKEKGIFIIEDCAQSHGASYNGKFAGSYGHLSAWSFCQDKIITTGGEGGMVTTNDEELYKIAWSLKDHGKGYDTVFNTKHPPGFRWLHENVGSNWRMTEMQASIGIDALEELPSWINHRQRIAKTYNKILKGTPGVRLTIPPPHIKHAYYKYYFFLDHNIFSKEDRDNILGQLSIKGVKAFSGSCGEVYKEKALEHLNIEPLHNTRVLTDSAIMLLTDPTVTKEQAKSDSIIIKKIVVDIVNKLIN